MYITKHLKSLSHSLFLSLLSLICPITRALNCSGYNSGYANDPLDEYLIIIFLKTLDRQLLLELYSSAQ